MSGGAVIRVRVAEIETVAERIRRFRFVSTDSQPLPAFSAGSHVVVSIRDGSKHRRNPYSLMGSVGDTTSYQISVLRTLDSRGGSAFMHEKVSVGSELEISYPSNLFPLDMRAKKHVLIAGGIGVTPILAMSEHLAANDHAFELHYCMRGREQGAYWQQLQQRYGRRVHLAFDDAKETLPLARILERQPLGTSLYVCGPSAMIDWVLNMATDMGWPPQSLHSERFLAPSGGTPFTVELAISGKTVAVDEHESLLEAIEAAGVDAPYLCRGGACGQCETRVVRHNGRLMHNDHYLTPEEQASGTKIMPCVSRFEGDTLVLER